MENLQANLNLIQQRLAAASDGKYPVPKLIAVTKTHPAEDILPLQNLGVTDIGENKVQEIMENCLRWRRIFGFTSSEGCNPIK